MSHRRSPALVVLIALLLAAAACKDSPRDGGGASTVGTPAPQKPPLSYVAVGASESVGTGADDPATEAWPRVLANTLGEGGRQVTFNAFAYGGALVPDSLASSVPKAEAVAPNLVTVWLNVNDIITELRGVRMQPYDQQLGEMVRRLRRGGATTVLLANTPAVETLPAYVECLTGGSRCLLPPALRLLVPQPEIVVATVDRYNREIAAVAQREGAVLVDLHAASLKARAEGREASLVAADGFHPSTAGHAAVAATFAEAARKAGV